MTKYDGGTAYPFGLNYPGLSIRDWFAGQALIGLVDPSMEKPNQDIAANAYAIANAMIKQMQAIEAYERSRQGLSEKEKAK